MNEQAKAPVIKLVPVNTELDREAIEMLERWLAEAKSEPIRALILARVNADGSVSTSYQTCRLGSSVDAVGAAARLQYRILRDMDATVVWEPDGPDDPDDPDDGKPVEVVNG